MEAKDYRLVLLIFCNILMIIIAFLNRAEFIDLRNLLSEKPPVTINDQNFDNIPPLADQSITNINNILVNSIQKKYGVNISYGKNTGCYFFNQSCVILENEDIINLALTNLEVYMKNYPDGFFKELNSFQGYRIILMSYLPDDSNGIAAFDWRDNRIYLKVNNNGVSEKTFHHENWHLMERYLDLKGEFMAGWDLYNPKGFSWGDISNNNYVQGLDQISKPKNISFQTLYGKTSATEDKAELFGYLLLNKRLQYYNTLEYGINLKLQKLYTTIDTNFNNINESAWKSWIKW